MWCWGDEEAGAREPGLCSPREAAFLLSRAHGAASAFPVVTSGARSYRPLYSGANAFKPVVRNNLTLKHPRVIWKMIRLSSMAHTVYEYRLLC